MNTGKILRKQFECAGFKKTKNDKAEDGGDPQEVGRGGIEGACKGAARQPRVRRQWSGRRWK